MQIFPGRYPCEKNNPRHQGCQVNLKEKNE